MDWSDEMDDEYDRMVDRLMENSTCTNATPGSVVSNLVAHTCEQSIVLIMWEGKEYRAPCENHPLKPFRVPFLFVILLSALYGGPVDIKILFVQFAPSK